MQNMEQAMREAMRLSQTDTGQQLLKKIQQSGGVELQQAMEKAAAGDYAQAQQAISALMDTPEIKKLLEMMGR